MSLVQGRSSFTGVLSSPQCAEACELRSCDDLPKNLLLGSHCVPGLSRPGKAGLAAYVRKDPSGSLSTLHVSLALSGPVLSPSALLKAS